MKVYPVVHINEAVQAVGQAELALDSGADGVYLIDHQSNDDDVLLGTFDILERQLPEAYIGVNLLGAKPQVAAVVLHHAVVDGSIRRAPDGLWVDDMLSGAHPKEVYDSIKSLPSLHNMRYLGGVAFKYTLAYTADPELAAAEARELEPFVDVVTTSGAGTGSPPSVEKIRAMKAAISGNLAVASGIDIHNLDQYGTDIDEVIIASSVETAKYSGIFDAPKLRDFIAAAHA